MSGGGGILADAGRERALRATSELCAEHGYQGLRLEAVAERAGVSRASLAQSLPDEEAAAKAAVEAILAAVVAIMGRFAADRSEAESYLWGIAAILALMAREPAFARISFIDARQTGPPALKERFDAGSDLLAAMLDRLRGQAAIDGQLPLAARAALGGAEAVVRRKIAGGETEMLPRLVPDFVYAAAVPFLEQREALRLARLGEEVLEGRHQPPDGKPL